MQGFRYTPYKHNAFMAAVREGRIDRVTEIISSRGPCYAEEWKDGYYLLRAAVKAKRKEIAKLLLTSGSKVNSRHKNPCDTPLHFAVRNGDIEVVQMLLDRGANIDARNLHGITPLHNAVGSKQTEIIGMLLSRGANIDAADNIGITPVHFAVGHDSKEIATLLLSRGANVDGKGNNATTSGRIAADTGDGSTPLHHCVGIGNEETTKLLLSKGADVNARDNYDLSPLHIASERGFVEIVEHLLKHGADVNYAATSAISKGYTPLHVAIENAREDNMARLLHRVTGVNAQEIDGINSICLVRKYLKIVEHLLKHEADFDSTTQNGHTPLYLAVENRCEKIVKLLLECGACVDAKDKNDKTILHFAVEQGCSIIVEHILKHRPDLNNDSNSSVLNVAVQGCGIEYRKIVKNLLQYGFTVNPKDANNFMRAAVENGYAELIEELSKHGSDVNMLLDSTFGKDSLPLNVATKNGHEEVAELLISYGADVNAPDETGRAPIFYATENADFKMIKLLLTNKANANDNPELLNIAVMTDCREIVEVLLQHGADVNANDKCERIPMHVVRLNEKGCCRLHSRTVPDKNVTREMCKLKIFKTSVCHVKLIKDVLEYKTGVEFKCKSVITPLHLSVLMVNNEIMEMVLNKGANVNAEDGKGETVLQYATENGNAEVVELLLKRGAKVDAASNYERMTPLHIAADFGYLDIAELLLKFGASVDSADNSGRTALHNACNVGRDGRIVTALLEHGSDVTVRSKNNYTALGYAKHGMKGLFAKDYNDDFEYIRSNVIVVKILKRHMVKIKAANLYTVNADVLSIPSHAIGSDDEELSDFQNECKKEVASMKSEKLVNTNITFYDILTKGLRQLAMYTKNERIVQAFGSGVYKINYPIYASMINSNFRKGEKRKECLEQGNKIFHFFFNNSPELPRVCTEKILSYLNDDDLRALTGAGKRLVYCQQS